jgi:hypothetical protein
MKGKKKYRKYMKKEKGKKCVVLKCWVFSVKRWRPSVAWMSFLKPRGSLIKKIRFFKNVKL